MARISFPRLYTAACAVTFAAVTACGDAEKVPEPPALEFETHAAFFSREMGHDPALDPHVFVQDSAAAAGVGPQNIAYVAGLRNARVGDTASWSIFTATGVRLQGFSLGSWLGARGDVTIVPNEDGEGSMITVKATGLTPNGVYSLFENHFDRTPVGFTPLDGTGTTNSFVADSVGAARVTVRAPDVPSHDNAVLLVYHSDGTAHGMERGPIGVTAHHQLIMRPPR